MGKSLGRISVPQIAQILALKPQDVPFPPEPKQGEAPREQFEALLNEYRRAGEFFVREMSEARTSEDRDKVRKEKYPDPVSYSARFLATADRAVGEAVEVESLIWCAQLGTRSPDGVKAIERLATAHAQDVRIVRIIDSLPCVGERPRS